MGTTFNFAKMDGVKLDTTDAAAVKAVFDSIDDAVETINVSFVMTKTK